MLQRIDSSVWLAPSAEVYGKVEIGEGSSLWPHCVIRAECQHVKIGRNTNLQDFVMVHVGFEHPTEIGDFCSITHRATVHGAVVEDDCLIGVAATLMDGVRIGRGSLVAPGAVVTPGTEVPPGSLVAGVPARVVRERDYAGENRENAWLYWRNARAYRAGDHRAWHGPEYEAFLAEKRAAERSDR